MGSSHHGDKAGPVDPTFVERLMREREEDLRANIERMIPKVKLGAQQDFPEGRYGPTDEGSLSFAVGHDERNGKVIVDFGSPVNWLALDAAQAKHLAQLLINHAEAASVSNRGEAIRRALEDEK